MGNHIESIQIDYDSQVISFKKLLSIFAESHDPTRVSFARQYISAIFYSDEKQREEAFAWKEAMNRQGSRPIVTEIMPLKGFYLAEAYHQKYWLRLHRELLREYQVQYPQYEDFLNSTSVARVNGYLGGEGTLSMLEKDMPGLGLSDEGQRRLKNVVQNRD